MLLKLRPALLFFAALSVTSLAPAQADPSSEPLLSVTSATVPTVAVEELIDPQGEPQLSVPADEAPATEALPSAETAPLKPTGDLSSMVAQLRSADAGSREVECLATGIYFESKSEPLAGQL